MSRPINVMMHVLTMHERNGWVCPYLSKWITDQLYDQFLRAFHGKPLEYCLTVDYKHNFMPAASARNVVGEQSIGVPPSLDWICMVDNDMAPQPNLLETVKNAPEDADIVVPRFSMWDEAKFSVTLCWGLDDPTKVKKAGGREYYTFDKGEGGFYPLTKCGTGCIFIRPRVFEKIQPPYFWYPKNKHEGNEGTEDICFTKKVVEAGMKIYGNASVMVGHYHNCNLEAVAHAIHLAQIEAVETYKKELTTRGTMGIEVGEAERPSDQPALAACPAC